LLLRDNSPGAYPHSKLSSAKLRSSPDLPRETGKKEVEDASQVAAPTESRTPDLHRAKNCSTTSADGRAATEAAWLHGKNRRNHGKNRKNLDRDPPSHGRT
jgi:hypothetical protein